MIGDVIEIARANYQAGDVPEVEAPSIVAAMPAGPAEVATEVPATGAAASLLAGWIRSLRGGAAARSRQRDEVS